MINDFLNLGWCVSDVIYNESYQGKKAKYIVFLKLGDFKLADTDGETFIPELTITGDGNGQVLKIFLSVSRLCSMTRMYLPVKRSLKKISKRHFYYKLTVKNYSFSELKIVISEILNVYLEHIKALKLFTNLNTTEQDRITFTSTSFLRRKSVLSTVNLRQVSSVSEFTVLLLLAPLRSKDIKLTAWNMYHTVLEKLLRGFKAQPLKRTTRIYKYKTLTDYERVMDLSIQMFLDLYKLYKQNV
jgi:hypothetical protein